uniref:Uncharacterized protein n=1 Tax=Setaria italica TaxID=4555 RepID=K3YP58_SETIT
MFYTPSMHGQSRCYPTTCWELKFWRAHTLKT